MAEIDSFAGLSPDELDAHWMPFTGNRQFKANPRLFVRAEGMHYTTADGRQVLDGFSGLWCCNAGHGRKEIADAVARQLVELDYSPAFQFGHPLSFKLAKRLADMAPDDLNRIFFCNSGSEAADTALKIARAYWRAKGRPEKIRLIGRAQGYHGVNFGGISIGGMPGNRKHFGPALDVDHLPHTLLPENRFSRGLPAHGGEAMAARLLDIIELHGAENIAAVMIEPFAGSAGVILPPKGYLQRLRELCNQYEILLIFDEVITGFGRTGAAFAAEAFGVVPDIMTTAKGISNGAVPMGAVFAREEIYNTFMQGPEHIPELAHGYTYSAHPVACAAAMATLDIYEHEKLFARVQSLAPHLEEALHSLRDCPHVIDIRNCGLAGAIQLQPRAGEVSKRAMEVVLESYRRGLLLRWTGDTIAVAPPFIIDTAQIETIAKTLRAVLQKVD
ncbi:aspartate aminotransferase family protein [Microbulbifer thermotolerans]|uniref:aspartate aminotransferase family protein n=1 Tax=Microbulbifer thermotolerans TaxID=252514 RepID=UPI002670DDD6|nr:aspartate aminotransferase family protein [Microbulbifer thermotolerans]WKT59293.1 aspartate aminotransferase family protein [Microbulbifer thermotolerans]